MGEGGTIGAPAAVLDAVNDALRDTGVALDAIPVRPEDVAAALHRDPVRETEHQASTPWGGARPFGREPAP
jgi:carbon-monoxide dehydrogenase large subunit